MRIRSSALGLCAALAFGFLAIQEAAAAQADAGDFVKGLGDRAIRVLTGSEVSDAERENRFRDLLHEGFDVRRIGRFVLGQYARRVTPEAMNEYHGLFEDLIVATYAARFAEYSGQQFVIKRVAELKERSSAIVLSEIQPTDGGPAIRVDWQVNHQDGAYKIVDVRVEGVSMSFTQRDEFAAVIRKNGGNVDALLEVLRKKTEGLKSKRASN